MKNFYVIIEKWGYLGYFEVRLVPKIKQPDGYYIKTPPRVDVELQLTEPTGPPKNELLDFRPFSWN